MMSAAVRITGVTKVYGRAGQQVTALADVSLDLNPGEIVLLRGRSGSGKTPLLNVLAGWVDQDAGMVEWDRNGGRGDRRWDQVAIVPQTLGLLDELSIDENVGLALRLGNAEPDEFARVDSIMERFEIGHLSGRRISESSLGERQGPRGGTDAAPRRRTKSPSRRRPAAHRVVTDPRDCRTMRAGARHRPRR